jgi:phosphatidate cytidylyltransferase
MLWTRVASSAVLAPLFLLVVYLESPWFNILAGAIGGLVAFEYMRIVGFVRANEAWTWRAALIIFAAPGAVAILEFGGLTASAALIAVLSMLIIFSGQARAQGGGLAFHAMIPYAALPAVALAYVVNIGGATSVFWLLAVVWGTDIGAYAFGRAIGGPKLAPSISPNKTWSGALGGMISAMLAAGALLWSYGLTATLSLAGLAAALSAISQVGDLFESGLKRRYQVKDSGSLIPGHGGIMDRFDGLWAAAPVVAVACVIMEGGVQKW